MSMLRRSKANENWFEKFGSSYLDFRKNDEIIKQGFLKTDVKKCMEVSKEN